MDYTVAMVSERFPSFLGFSSRFMASHPTFIALVHFKLLCACRAGCERLLACLASEHPVIPALFVERIFMATLF